MSLTNNKMYDIQYRKKYEEEKFCKNCGERIDKKMDSPLCVECEETLEED